MTSLAQKAFLQAKSVSVQCVRFRGKINIQRPREPCYEKARILRATQLQLPRKPYDYNCVQKKIKLQALAVDNPYDRIIANEVRDRFHSSAVIAFFHLNPLPSEDQFNVAVAFHQKGMTLKVYGKKILKLALENTKFESTLPLFESRNCIVFSPEPQTAQILRIIKKVPQMLLIGGVAEDRFLSKNEFTALANMPDIQVVRAQFASVLDNVGGQLVQNLQAHQTNLVSLLDQYAQGDQQKSAEETKAPIGDDAAKV